MYKQYSKAKYLNVSKEEFEKQLKYCKKYLLYGINEKYDDFRDSCLKNMTPAEYNVNYPSSAYYYYVVKITKAYLTYKRYDKWINIYYNLENPEGGELVRSYNGGEAYRYLQRYAHIPALDKEKGYGYERVERPGQSDKIKWSIKNIMPSPYVNEKIEVNKYYKVYYYDKHRAFLEGCKGLFPDTEHCEFLTTIKEGQVGFNEDGIPNYVVGEFCLYVFNLIEIEGLSKWADRMEEKILDAKKKGDKQKTYDLKHMYTDAIGMLCRHNPFIHNVIVDNCMKYMNEAMDENTLYSVTDSIISTVERKDLKQGIHTGEFEQDCVGIDIYFSKTSAGYQLYTKNNNEYVLYKSRERGSSTLEEKINLRNRNKCDLNNICNENLELFKKPLEYDTETHLHRIDIYKFQNMKASINKEYKLLEEFKIYEQKKD